MNAFFIGAGSSYGTLCRCGTPGCPPLAVDFGKALAGISDWGVRYPTIAEVADALGSPLPKLGLEAIWSHIDYCAKLGRALPISPSFKAGDLKRALLLLYGQACDREAEKLPISEKYTLGCLLKNRMQAGDVVISFNYDTLIERLAKRFGHTLQSVCGASRPGTVKIVKPHGSASWCLDLKSRKVISMAADGSPLLDSLIESDVLEEREPLLLGAVPIKSELIREVQQACVLEVFETIMRQWRAVVEAVRDADVFIVVGYSFPKEDQYGRFLLREGVRLRSKPIAMEFHEVPARNSSTAASIMEAFSAKGIHLVWKGEVQPP